MPHSSPGATWIVSMPSARRRSRKKNGSPSASISAQVPVDHREVPVDVDRVAGQRHVDQLPADLGQHRAQLARALRVAADRGAERREPGAELGERAALHRRRARHRGEDRHPGRGDDARDVRLLAAPHPHRHPPDHGAAGHGDERVAHVHRLGEGAAQRTRAHDLDAVGLERRDEPGVLRLGARDVGRLAPGPVPAAVGVDERAQIRVPGVGADPLQRGPGRAYEHAAQAPDLVRGAPRAAPDGLDLVVERRLGRRRHPRLVQLGGHGARRLRQTSSTSRTLAVR